jgi:L-fuculose-phosphate aldolase
MENNESLKLIRQQIIDGGLRLLKEGLVVRTWGNISVRVDGTHMLITPSGRAYTDLTPDDIVLVDYHTSRFEGTVRPSSEKGLHCEIYLSRKEVHAVIHTHQMNASTVAAAHRELPPILDDMAQVVGPSVRVSKYAHSATRKISRNTVRALKGRNAVLMANHGAVCVGRDLEEAFVVCQVLEKSCKAFIEAEFIGGAKSIRKFDARLMHRLYIRKYSREADQNKTHE